MARWRWFDAFKTVFFSGLLLLGAYLVLRGVLRLA